MAFVVVEKLGKLNPSQRLDSQIMEVAKRQGTSVNRIELLFCNYIAMVLRKRIQDSIIFQQVNGIPMRRLYPALSASYKKRKPWGTKGKFYVNTGWLRDNIGVYKYRDHYFVGFSRAKFHPGARATAQDIFLWNEQGTDRIPARPVIVPNVRFVKNRLAVYFKYFEKTFL